jgi:hypothetical protein
MGNIAMKACTDALFSPWCERKKFTRKSGECATRGDASGRQTHRYDEFILVRTAAFDSHCALASDDLANVVFSRTERSSPISHFSALLLLHDHWSCWADAAKDAPWAFVEPSS